MMFSKLASGKNVFFFWHQDEEQMPACLKMNIWNARQRLADTQWNIFVFNMDKSSNFFIGNFIDLPNCLYDLENKISDTRGIWGNRSDIIRLMLLHKYGGCYFDASTILLKNDILNINLYKKMQQANAQLAGYTNVTFTRKTVDQDFFYPEAKDGMELGVLFAQKNTCLLSCFIDEIKSYWAWKTHEYSYKDYPPFSQFGLTSNSFLNEYHIHYAIYHLLLAKYPEFLPLIAVQSMHMQNKEKAVTDGPYSIQDRFCRGNSAYEKASPQRLLKALLPGDLDDFSGKVISFESRIKLFFNADLLVFPGYLRVEIEQYFHKINDFYQKNSAYKFFYRLNSSAL